jgi:hypothetical protein
LAVFNHCDSRSSLCGRAGIAHFTPIGKIEIELQDFKAFRRHSILPQSGITAVKEQPFSTSHEMLNEGAC